jgi:hypothetical protein
MMAEHDIGVAAQGDDERLHLHLHLHLPVLMRRAGVRVTHSRLLVLQVLYRHQGEGLTANDIYQRMLDIGNPLNLSTIYSVLQSFKLRRLVAMHRTSGRVQVFSYRSVSPARDESVPAAGRAAMPVECGPGRP